MLSLSKLQLSDNILFKTFAKIISEEPVSLSSIYGAIYWNVIMDTSCYFYFFLVKYFILFLFGWFLYYHYWWNNLIWSNNELRRRTSYTPNMAPWKIDPPKNRVSCNSSIGNFRDGAGRLRPNDIIYSRLDRGWVTQRRRIAGNFRCPPVVVNKRSNECHLLCCKL